MIVRLVPERFIRPEWRGDSVSPWPDFEDDDGKMRPVLLEEIEEWCRATFGRVPMLYFDEYMRDNDTLGANSWLIYFNNETEAVTFKLRWSDYGRR
jgi:hypothetical protein